MKKTLIIGAILTLGGALAGCDDPIEERNEELAEEMAERSEERREAAGEALEEMAEGAGEANAALRGENEVATRIATNFIGAVRQVNEEAAGKMDPETEVVNEACRAIGQLGFREGIDPLMSRVTPLTEMSPGDIGEEQRAELLQVSFVARH